MAVMSRAAIIASLTLSLSMFGAGAAKAGQLEDAMSAYQKKDFATAARLLKLVAETGNPTAQNLLGFMYHDGEGVPQDLVRAYVWFYLAVSLFPADSQDFRDASDAMDLTGKAMTADKISAARAMARKCQAQRYKNCE
jgi:TPR repeat protein